MMLPATNAHACSIRTTLSVSSTIKLLKTKPVLLLLFLLIHSFLFAQPILSSFSPASGPVGSTVLINGSGFAGTPAQNMVFFGAVRATVQSASSNALTVTVPPGTTFQPVTVTANNLTGFSRKPFLLTFPDGGPISGYYLETNIALATDLNPNMILFSDFDGDGRADLATANNYSLSTSATASLSVLRNQSSFHSVVFDTAINIASGKQSYTVAAEDLDADGKPDLIATSITDRTISVFKNNCSTGQISFGAKQDFTSGSSPYSIATADFNKDGKPDVAVVNYSSNTVSVFQNTSTAGAISLAPRVDFVTGLSPTCVAIGDFDGDGLTDMAVTNQSSASVSIFRNTSIGGTISFAARVDLATGTGPSCVAIGDLDGDGKDDIAVCNNYAESFSVIRNLSSGGTVAFAAKSDISTNGRCNSISMGDINGDGKPDLVLPSNGSIYLYQNNSTAGSSSFSLGTTTYTNPQARIVAIGDIDNDGKNDLASDANSLDRRITVIRNKSNEPVITSFAPMLANTGDTITITGRNFLLASSVSVGSIPASSFTVVSATTIKAVVGNANSGDIVVTTPYGTAALNGYVYPGPPSIQVFTPASGTAGDIITITGKNLVGVTNVLFGGVAAASYRVVSPFVLKVNLGAGGSGPITVSNTYGTATISGFSYTPPPKIISYTPQQGPVNTVVTLAGSNFSPSIQNNIVYFGPVRAQVIAATADSIKVRVPAGTSFSTIRLTTGTNGFITQTTGPFITTFAGASTFAANSFSSGASFFRGFSSQGAFSFSLSFVNADFDNDGKPDVATIGRSYYSPSVSILKNKSTNTATAFERVQLYGVECDQILTGDFDGDGKLDLLTTEQGSVTYAFKNTSSSSTISFNYKRIDSSIVGWRAISGYAVEDIDGDGKLDIVLLKNIGQVGVLRNTTIDGDISFAKEVSIGSTISAGYRIYIADLNGDGRPDIVSDNGYSGTGISVFANRGIIGVINFAPPVQFANGSNLGTISFANLIGSSKPEIIVAENGRIAVYENKSDTSNLVFTLLNTIYPQYDANQFVVNDMDGDSLPDIVAQTDTYLYLYKNLRSGNTLQWSAPTVITPRFTGTISSADPDMDGRPDIMIMGLDSMLILSNQIGKPIISDICLNSSAMLQSDLTGTTYRWQMNDGSGFRNITDSITFSGTATRNLQLMNVSPLWDKYQFRCFINNSITSRIFAIRLSNVWRGTVSSAWENPANWSCGIIPDANTNVLISSGPVILNSDGICKTLTISSGVSFTVTNGHTLTIIQ